MLLHNLRVITNKFLLDFLYFQNEWNRPRRDDPDDHPRWGRLLPDEAESEEEDGSEPRQDKAVRNDELGAWQRNIILLYNRWGVGDRNNIPAGGIGPDELHIFPDNIRHSVPRRACLRESFPISDIRLNGEAIEERRADFEKNRQEKADAVGERA